jgi:lysyl-tRNA synthetase class 2
MLELYRAYADYEDFMTLVENLMRGISEIIHNSLTIQYQEQSIDFSKPFQRFTMEEVICKYNENIKSEDIRDLNYLTEFAEKMGIKIQANYGPGKIQAEIFDKTCESHLIAPTFICAYPTEISPLSRKNDKDPFVTDRFEFFVSGRELANGFSELNDSEDQAQRFLEQVSNASAGDEEAMSFDHDYIRALEYGLPPTAGLGIGIDRLVMLFTDSASIRDVLLFPYMRHENFD